ncbi:MAG: PilZ domain-containing protein [Desulfobulbaceae bacterium]|nr:PilZ domain-containing protein [Desulfobulbaceae bacterium]
MVINEKRKHVRVEFIIRAIFETEGQIREDLQCRNISMSGLFLRTENPLPVGTRGNLLIVLECGENRLEVRAESKVARVVGSDNGLPWGMGLEYVRLDPDSSLNLYNVIKYQGGIEKEKKV